MRQIRSTVIAALLSSVLVFVLLAPMSGQDSSPPECWAVFGYVVPCGLGPDQPHGSGFAFAGAITAAILVGVGSAVGRRDASTSQTVT